MKAMRILMTILLVGSLALAGCKDESTNPQDEPEAPGLPPQGSMSFDFDSFPQAPPPRAPLSQANFTAAALSVAVIGVGVTLVTALPELAFAAALSTQPTYEGDNTFLWHFAWNGLGAGEIDLRGTLDGDHVNWSLRLTNNDTLDHTLWYEGQSSLTNNSGYWIFYAIQDDPSAQSARVDWSFVSEEDSELVFENIRVGDEHEGDRLTFTLDGTTRTIEFHPGDGGDVSFVTWDSETGAGSLQVPSYNGGEEACWDETLQDVDCPVTAR